MPSPIAPAPTPDLAASWPHESPHHPAAPSPLSNGVNGRGAAQHPQNPSHVDGHSGDDTIIRDGKQKAKAMLAASGIDVGQGAQAGPSGQPGTASPSAFGDNMSAPRGHKRSRSGSRRSSPSPEEQVSRDQGAASKNYLLQRYINRDQLATIALLERDQQSVEIIDELNEDSRLFREWYTLRRQQNPAAVFGYGYLGYGNGLTDMKGSRLQYPQQAKRPGNRRSRPYPRVPREKLLAQADQIEELVPLRLDIELEKIKLRDTLTWNLHDRITDTAVFAENMVEDFRLPPELRGHVAQYIHREINEQIQDYYPHASLEEEPLDPHLPYTAYKNDEMRILIKLNITIGQHALVDQFEWELNNPLNSPEEFARQMACDLSLSGEFTTAIAHSIREQCQMFTKSLYITGHPFDGRPVEDADVRDNFLPSPLPSVFRPMQSAKDYQPYLYALSEADLERTELSIMREQRRQKRSVNRRGGPALPDLKDRQRTVRTLIVSSVIPGAAETIEESHIFKVTRSKKSGGRQGRLGDDDSEESDSDVSAPESPAPSMLQSGTARTRGMRGAATVAQAAMRSALGRSATPEVSMYQQEVRSSSRSLRHEVREESVPEPTSLIVKLRISPMRLREFQRNPRAFARAPTPQSRPTPSAGSMPPPPSPALMNRGNTAGLTEASPKPQPSPSPLSQSQTPSQSQQQWNYYPDGRVDTTFPQPGTPPAPPPTWLLTACTDLQKRYPNDLFEPSMRYSIVDTTTDKSIPANQFPANSPLPPNHRAQYLPRMRCRDCPGKMYTVGPGNTLENFLIHLENKGHRAKVEERLRGN